jgi:hypothetical protein
VETDYFEGKHEISGKRAYDFLMEKLARQMLLSDKSS